MAKNNIKDGDLVDITTDEKKLRGILMPSSKDSLVLKLDSGYNIGMQRNKIKKINLIKKYNKKEEKIKERLKFNKALPTISILHTGGTIASKVDYRTGAVTTRFTPEDLIAMFPELKNIANIKSRLVFQMFSEDMEPEHWQILAKEVTKELEKSDGVIITHGTDTMHYTSSALSFMLQDLDKPVILVGAQRSSDRGSSDAFLNLICAINFITKTNFAGVAICMHKDMSDDTCYIHKGTKVRKLHTSRRDAFKSINEKPIAEVTKEGKVNFLSNYIKKESKKTILKNKFEKKIALIKIRPGFSYKELEFYEKNKYKGIIIEGTGLGHMPANILDKYTKDHKKLLDTLKRLSKNMLICMASQCIFGRVNMNVYSTGIDLQNSGVIPLEDILSETAYVKLGWALANAKNLEEAKTLMLRNIAGEISERTTTEFIE